VRRIGELDLDDGSGHAGRLAERGDRAMQTVDEGLMRPFGNRRPELRHGTSVQSGIKAKAFLCVPFGHKWSTESGSFDSGLVLRCKRCGRTRDAGAETRDRSRNPGGIGPFPR
jgi:hypothetical protein